MSPDEVSPSSHAADQAWFSMLLANDPNTALVGSLRPPRQHPLWGALLRPFQGPAPLPAPEADGGTEKIPGLRPRSTAWVGAVLLLALGVGLAGVRPERVRLAAVAPEAAPVLTTNIVPPWAEPRAQAREEASAVLPRTAKAAAPSASAKKKKPAARSLRRVFGRALAGPQGHESFGPRLAASSD